MEQNNKVTLKETLQVHARAVREFHKAVPAYFPVTLVQALVDGLAPYVTVWFSARILGELAGARRSEELWRWVMLTLVVTALVTLARGLLSRWQTVLDDRCDNFKKFTMADKWITMDFADTEKTEVRDLHYKLLQNEGWASWGINVVRYMLPTFLRCALGILGAVALTVSLFTQSVPDGPMAFLNHPLALLLLVVLLLAIAVLNPVIISKAQSYWQNIGEDTLLNNRIYTVFGYSSVESPRAMDMRMYRQDKICSKILKQDRVMEYFSKCARGGQGLCYGANEALGSVLTGIVYVFVCLKAWAGAFGVGAVTQYVGAVTALSENISGVLESVGYLRNNTPYLKQVYEFLDIPNAMYQGSLTTEKRADRQYDVEFKDVSFKYPGSDTWALRHVNMKFKVGSRLAVVGENGSGKTTFIKLLCRLYDPQEGQILLNGIDIRKYRYDDYMDIFSVVFQDFQLFAQPLGNNVAGAVEYDRERAEKALLDAGFGDRLATMGKGLDTMLYRDLSEEGVEVSGGEAQKIAIARALYKDAPFIVLDEPTAALDPIAEAEIYEKFDAISGDKTAIYISHRLSSCKFCDEIAVFDHGAVIQQGKHEELLEQSGKYHDLWHAQAQYYAEKTA